MKIYGLYDRATESFGMPITQANDNVAIRSVKMEMDNANSLLRTKPSDFELWKLAEYLEETGEIQPNKKLVVRIEDLITKGE